MSALFFFAQPVQTLDKLEQAIRDSRRHRISVAEIQAAFQRRMDRKRRRARAIALVGILLWLGALFVFGVMVLPQTLFKFFPEYTDRLAQSLGQTVEVERSGFGDQIYQIEKVPEPMYVPPYDPELPDGNWLIIESIGVKTQIFEGEDWEEVLRNGVWRAYQFSDPEDRSEPTVLAAHRFGYLTWTNQFRRTSSFYNLPKLQNGDQVEIIWNKRRYVYEIFEGYTDTKLQHLDSDLILFTCEVLNSDRRIIRKARLIVPEGFAKT